MQLKRPMGHERTYVPFAGLKTPTRIFIAKARVASMEALAMLHVSGA